MLIGPLFDPEDKDHAAAVAKIFVGLEVSERDEAFLRTICGDNFNWWNSEEANYPTYQDIAGLISTKVYSVSILSGSFEGMPV